MSAASLKGPRTGLLARAGDLRHAAQGDHGDDAGEWIISFHRQYFVRLSQTIASSPAHTEGTTGMLHRQIWTLQDLRNAGNISCWTAV